MSDAAITSVVAGLVTVTTMIVGFLTLWVKLRYGAKKAEEAATNTNRVERKLDVNTAVTNAVDSKTDTIVDQTNGAMTQVRVIVGEIAERVSKLEEYNHTASHRVIDALNAVHLKVAEIVALQPRPAIAVSTLPSTEPSPEVSK